MWQMTITREKNWIVAWAPKAVASDGRQDSTGRGFLLSASCCKGACDQWELGSMAEGFRLRGDVSAFGGRGQGRKRCRTRGQTPRHMGTPLDSPFIHGGRRTGKGRYSVLQCSCGMAPGARSSIKQPTIKKANLALTVTTDKSLARRHVPHRFPPLPRWHQMRIGPQAFPALSCIRLESF